MRRVGLRGYKIAAVPAFRPERDSFNSRFSLSTLQRYGSNNPCKKALFLSKGRILQTGKG